MNGCDVLALQEVRLTKDAKPIAVDSLPSWSCIWGKDQQLRNEGGSSLLDAKQGGVGVLSQKRHVCAPTPRSDLGDELYETGRWQSVSVKLNGGAALFVVVTIYGFSRANEGGETMAENEDFIRKVLLEASSLGDVPVIIIGDFNVTHDNSHVLRSEHTAGRWMDAAQLIADLDESRPAATYYRADYQSRIDMALINPVAATMLSGFRIQERLVDGEQRGHQMITVDFDTPVMPTYAWKTRALKRLPERPQMDEDDQRALAEIIKREMEVQFWKAYVEADIDALYGSWCDMAESYLLREASVTGSIEEVLTDPGYRGRGKAAEAKRVRVGAGNLGAHGTVPDPERTGLETLARSLAELKRVLESGHIEGTERQWKSAAKKGKRWLVQGAFREAWERQDPPMAREVEYMLAGIRERIADANRACRNRVIKRWRKRREERIRQNVGAAFKEFRESDQHPLAVLRRPDGSVTGDIHEMDTMLRQDWLPIFAKHADGERPVPDAERFLKYYQHQLVHVPQELPGMGVKDLQRGVARMSENGAAGLDGWSPRDLKRLPLEILELLLHVYDLVEWKGVWPETMCWAGISLIPKGEGGKPLDMRPITVTSAIYRLWAGVRVRQSAEWQASWMHPGQHGGRERHSPADALMRISLEFEQAVLDGTEMRGVAFDLAKAFDNVPQEIMFRLLAKFGADVRIINGLRGMYQQVKRRFRIGAYVGEAFTATNGILQGCPLSIMMLNALMAVLHRALDPYVVGESFVDDLTVMDSTVQNLNGALRVMEIFMYLTDQRVNEDKTRAFGLGQDPGLRYDGHQLKWVRELKILGVYLNFEQDAIKFKYKDDKVDKLVNLLHRIRYSGLNFDQRVLVTGGLVGSRLSYGAEVLDLTSVQERQLRVAVGRAIWQKTSTQRSPGLLLTIFAKGHVCDPAQIPLVRRFVTFRKFLLNSPGLLPRLLDVWKRKTPRTRIRAGGIIANMLYAARRMGVTKKESDEGDFRFSFIGNEDVSVMGIDGFSYDHYVREQARRMVWRAVEKDRDRSGNASGIAEGVDRDLTKYLYDHSSAKVKGILRKIVTGAVWTQCLRARMPRNNVPDTCPHCDLQVPEDLQHLWWLCPAWEHLRDDRVRPDPMECAECLRKYGIATKGCTYDRDRIVAIQDQMVKIFQARFADER